LICVQTDNGVKFAGFWPDKGQVLLTYDQLKCMMNQSYNKAQNSVTHKMIEDWGATGDEVTMSPEKMINHAKAELAKLLTDDQVAPDAPIVGIAIVMRFDPVKLANLVHSPTPNSDSELWHNRPFDPVRILSMEGASSTGVSHTVEVKDARFGTYELQTETQTMLFEKFGQMADYLTSTPRDLREFVALCVTGDAGLGKTHLATATTRLCAGSGLSVFMMAHSTISEMFQESGGSMPNMNAKIQASDLIVLDDINSKYGVGSQLLKQVMKFAVQHKKAVIITSNHADLGYFDLMDTVTYDDLIGLNFYMLHDLKGDSWRQPWIEHAVYDVDHLDHGLNALCTSHADVGAGIVVAGIDNIGGEGVKIVSMISDKIVQLDPNSRIYVADEPYRNHKVHDMFLHALKKSSGYTTVIMRFDHGYGYESQLIELISKTHDLGLKVVVLANQSIDIGSQLRKELDMQARTGSSRIQPRITDRTKVIFPGLI
jgi:DNA replication protein DnaC